MGRWKVVRSKTERRWELFDLAADPGETNNVATSHPEIIARFKTFLENARTPSPNYADPF